MNREFYLPLITKKAIELFNDAAKILNASKNENVRKLSVQIPKSIGGNEAALSLVFAGQYSAGKSTILKILTGEDIKTGEGVTTDAVSKYHWNGLTVIDTPGIHTQKHPDHDKLTYDAISKADLIVFVLTNEGFGAHLGKHFRHLVYDMNKGAEIMLVVNKMDNDAIGNDPSVRKIKKIDIDKVLAPTYSTNDMYISFISADAYKELQKTSDAEEIEYYKIQSGWDGFINNLNRFSSEKQLLGKCTTPLFVLEDVLVKALGHYHSDSAEMDASKELLDRNRRSIKECKDSILRRVWIAVGQQASKIINIGNKLALELEQGTKEDAYEKETQKYIEKTNAIADDTSLEIQKIIDDEYAKVEHKLYEIGNSPLARNLVSQLKQMYGDVKLDGELERNIEKCAKISETFGKWLMRVSSAPNAKGGWYQIFKIGNYSKSPAHKAVLEMGKFFGHKFKPWEAAKIAGKIGQAGKFLSVAGAIVGVAFQIWNDNQESESEKKLLEARSSIRGNFRDAANEIEMLYNDQTKKWVAKELDPQLEELDSAIEEIDNMRQIEDTEYKNIKLLLERTRALISEIQNISYTAVPPNNNA